MNRRCKLECKLY